MNRYLFLPHCMRCFSDCTAKMSEEGYICEMCGKCDIARIITHAEKRNFKVFIVPGGSIVKKILKSYKINLSKDIIIGVACENEISIFRKDLFAMKPNKKLHKAVELIESGCMNTKADTDKLLATMDSFDKELTAKSHK